MNCIESGFVYKQANKKEREEVKTCMHILPGSSQKRVVTQSEATRFYNKDSM